MQTFIGMILGALLLVCGVYIYDSMQTSTVASGNAQANRTIVKTLQDQRWEDGEPYVGITAESRFQLVSATNLGADMTVDRLNRRRSLLNQFDRARRDLAVERIRIAGRVLDGVVSDARPIVVVPVEGLQGPAERHHPAARHPAEG